MEAFYLYRWEQLLGARPVCPSRSWKKGRSVDRNAPLHSVRIKTLGLTLRCACTNRTLANRYR
jgi:hypothetical protein